MAAPAFRVWTIRPGVSGGQGGRGPPASFSSARTFVRPGRTVTPITHHHPSRKLRGARGWSSISLLLLLAVGRGAENSAGDPGQAGRESGAKSALGMLGDELRYKLERIGEAARVGRWSLYLSGYDVHLPYSYSAEQRHRLNSVPWGGGLARSVTDADGDVHEVYAMGISDSHYHAQFTAGYVWTRFRKLGDSGGAVGWGYTVFVYSRRDIADNLPLPGLLPVATLRYRDVEITGTFIPRFGTVQGDTVYFFSRIRF
jgi:lipid IVA palmitoyltransferase